MLLCSIYRNISDALYVIISSFPLRVFFIEPKGYIFSAEQEAAVVSMIVANNVIKLHQIREFLGTSKVSLTAIDCFLKSQNHMTMKQLY